MKAAHVACLTLLLVGLSAASTADAQKPGKKCDIVNCLVDPCRTTTCKPNNPEWQCKANYCGGCNTVWVYKSTGLKTSTCPPDFCPEIFLPVCGVNGMTYPNSCYALRSGIKVRYNGACKCPKKAAPVCGADGINYRNKCLARSSGTTVAYLGTCLFPLKCAKANAKYKPVCDPATKLTWTNACTAKLNHVAKPVDGPCISGPCAMCTLTSGCNTPHRCKGNKKYTCEQAACRVTHILDSGKRVTYGLCSPVYKNKLTGYPAAACYP
jgi:hypothetical protein